MSVTPIRPSGGAEPELLLPPHGNVPSREARPSAHVNAACRWCDTATSPAVLAQLGARCQRCYEAWFRTPQAAPPMADKRANGARAWAHALRSREEGGEHLTSAQRDMWRTAIAAHRTLDEVRDGANVPAGRITAALQATGDLPEVSDAEWESLAAEREDMT